MDTVGGQARLWTQKCTGIPMHGWEGRAKRGCRRRERMFAAVGYAFY